MNPQVFREYDIRGVADRDFSDDFVRDLGRALAEKIKTASAGDTVRMAIGRDCRTTSPRIYAAFVDGITERGVDILDIGVASTPMLYFAAHHFKTDGAVIITGSHNPAPDNGFKLLQGTSSIHGDGIRALRTAMEAADWGAPAATAGTVSQADAMTPYVDYAKSQLRLTDRRFKIVVDAGNGTGGPPATRLYRELGFDVVELYCDMDGTFPNHHPDPTVAKNMVDLQERVIAENAQLGIALDGDADRIGAVDGKGRIIWGDQLMILFGRAILKDEPGAKFIGEVKCSQALYDELEKAGGDPLMWKVGHSLIKAKMKEIGAALGGEMSGHIFFENRYLGFDDGVYSGARLLELVASSDLSLADHYDTLPQMHNTPEIRVECSDDIKFDVVAKTTARLRVRDDVTSVVDVDGARANFGDGWGLVRASNTQPSLVVRCEAATPERLIQIRAAVEEEIAAARSELG